MTSEHEYVDSKIEPIKAKLKILAKQQEESLIATERQIADFLINLIAQNTILVIRANNLRAENIFTKLVDDARKSKAEITISKVPLYIVGAFRDKCDDLLKKLGINSAVLYPSE